MVAETQRRTHLLRRLTLHRDVELARGEAREIRYVPALHLGHLPGGLYLYRRVQKPEELRRGVTWDSVVQRFRRLGGEDQAESVLAGLGSESQRALGARGHRARRRQRLRLVHHEQTE